MVVVDLFSFGLPTVYSTMDQVCMRGKDILEKFFVFENKFSKILMMTRERERFSILFPNWNKCWIWQKKNCFFSSCSSQLRAFFWLMVSFSSHFTQVIVWLQQQQQQQFTFHPKMLITFGQLISGKKKKPQHYFNPFFRNFWYFSIFFGSWFDI